MKNKKAFTLVELLAVIAILAIVLIIAIPKVENLIEQSKEKTFTASSYEIVKASKSYCLTKKLVDLAYSGGTFTPSNGKLISGSEELSVSSVELTGESYVTIDEDCNVQMSITNGRYYASKEYDEVGVLVALGEDAALTRDEMSDEIKALQASVTTLNSQITALTDGKVSTETLNTQIAALTDKTNTNNVFLKTYPIGSIYMSKESTNPSGLFGGTWVAWGSGRVPVGVNTSDTSFDTVEETGGEKAHTLSVTEMPSHGHIIRRDSNGVEIGIGGGASTGNTLTGTWSDTSLYPYSIFASYTGGGGSHNNLQPYITVYMWKRTA